VSVFALDFLFIVRIDDSYETHTFVTVARSLFLAAGVYLAAVLERTDVSSRQVKVRRVIIPVLPNACAEFTGPRRSSQTCVETTRNET